MPATVSRKYQVVIPKAIRTALGIKAGSKVELIAKGKVACLIPVLDLADIQADLKANWIKIIYGIKKIAPFD